MGATTHWLAHTLNGVRDQEAILKTKFVCFISKYVDKQIGSIRSTHKRRGHERDILSCLNEGLYVGGVRSNKGDTADNTYM